MPRKGIRMRISRRTALLGLLTGVGLARSQSNAQATIFEGRPRQTGDVVVLGPSEIRPSELQGISLLPIDCIGRTSATELTEDQPRLRDDVPGAGRLALPGGEGSLYKYKRGASSGSVFGFFLVDVRGAAHPLFERAGTGPSGRQDPFLEKLAVGARAKHILVATTLEAGGDLWEVGLADGTAVERTAGLEPLAFQPNGLVLNLAWGFGLSSSGPVRFERCPGGTAELVSMPPRLPWFGPDVVRSADESTVAFVAGQHADSAYVLICRQTGGAQQVSETPQHVSGAGFLPEVRIGPTLALSTDGSRVAWRSEGTLYNEGWVRSTRNGSSDLQVTRDENFDDTLDETGVIAFFSTDSLVMLVGRRNGSEVGQADLFRVDARSGGSLAITNLTGTSGITQTPFDYGTLKSDDGVLQVPGSPAWLVHDSRRERLLWVEPGRGAQVFFDRVRSLDFVEPVGDYLVAGLRRRPGVDRPVESTHLLQIPRGGLGSAAILLPDGSRMLHPTGSRTGARFVGVLEQGSGEWLGRLDVPSDAGLVLSNRFVQFGPTLGRLGDGSVLASLELPASRLVFHWSDLGLEVLRSGAEGFVLPGE